MQKETHNWWSTNLSKKMEIAIYGHYGFAILLFPALTDDNLECENNGLLDAISPYITKGKCKVFAIGSVNFESWVNKKIQPSEKSLRHYQYNNYIVEELIPYIFGECGGPAPIIACGAAIGAYHAANTYFRRPDIFHGVIAMSGIYNIEHLTEGFFDDNCYFNSPVHYLPNLNDNYWLSFLTNKNHVHILTGSGDKENPSNSLHLTDILSYKGIPHTIDIWDKTWDHEWKTWNAMLPQILEQKM